MRAWVMLAVPLLAACGDESADDRAEQDSHDVALVEKANNTLPPLDQIEPEPISDADVERYDLLGAACNYAPGTSLGNRVFARESDAFVKIDGQVERFAADPGSRELPARSRSLYASKDYSLRLQIHGVGTPAGKLVSYDGDVEIRDPHGRIVYQGTGPALCGTEAP